VNRFENFITSKIWRATLILAELLLVFELLCAMIIKGFPRDIIYWTAVIFLIIIAFLAYKTFERAVIRIKQVQKIWNWSAWNRWLTLGLFLEVVGIGGPWVMYYSGIDVLRRASASWPFFLIAYFGFMIYMTFHFPKIRWNSL
jgi:hypothetical protein